MLNRFLYKDNQIMDEVLTQPPFPAPDTINQLDYYKTAKFSQPGIVGIGYVTSAGLAGSFFFPDKWMPSAGVKTATGVYTITHNIGSIKYVPIINLVDSASKNFTVTVNANDIVVRTFTSNTAAAVDTAFMFVFYLNS